MRSILVSFLTCMGALTAGEDQKLQSPRQQYEELLKEYVTAERECLRAMTEAKTPDEGRAAAAKFPDQGRFANQFLDLAEKHPDDPVAIDAITWVFEGGKQIVGPIYDRAVDLVLKDHITSGRAAPAYRCIALVAHDWSRKAERLFRETLVKNRQRDVRAWSHFGLGQILRLRVKWGKPTDTEAGQLLREAEEHYELVAEEAGDIKPPQELMEAFAEPGKYGSIWPVGASLAEIAQQELFVLRHLAIGDVAPEIKGEDIDDRPMKLSDYRGKVVVLDFWGHW